MRDESKGKWRTKCFLGQPVKLNKLNSGVWSGNLRISLSSEKIVELSGYVKERQLKSISKDISMIFDKIRYLIHHDVMLND